MTANGARAAPNAPATPPGPLRATRAPAAHNPQSLPNSREPLILWSLWSIRQSRFDSLNECPRWQIIARVVSASSRVLHIRDLDERISVENAAVMVLAKKRNLVN